MLKSMTKLCSILVFVTAAATPAMVSCSDGGGGVRECNNLCANAPTASPTEGGCTSDFITNLGYNTDHPDCVQLALDFAAGNATVGQCVACYDAIDVSGGDCAAAETTCFGASGADAGGGTPDAGGGQADAPTGAVTTCDQLCQLAPVATPIEGGCTTDEVINLGYNTDNVACSILAASFAAGTATAAECDACYAVIGISDADCQAVHGICF